MDWPAIAARIAELRSGIHALTTSFSGGVTREGLAWALSEQPETIQVLHLLFAVSSSITFVDGSTFPYRPPATAEEASATASVAWEMGFPRLVTDEDSIDGLVRVAVVAAEARRRRFRRGSALAKHVRMLLSNAVDSLTSKGLSLEISTEIDIPPPARRRAEFVVVSEGRPIAIINTVFETVSGGRQQRDLAINLPNLQMDINEWGISLIVIADGPGMKQMSRQALVSLMETVPYVMNLSQARKGLLEHALAQALSREGRAPAALRPLRALVATGLAIGSEVRAENLPGDPVAARLALASYKEENPDFALLLAPSGNILRWERASLIERTFSLAEEFSPREAVDLLAELIAVESTDTGGEPPLDEVRLLSLRPDPVLPRQMVAAAAEDPPSDDVLRALARLSLELAPESRLAVVITPTKQPADGWHQTLRLQSTLAANVVILDIDEVSVALRNKQSLRDSFVASVVEQSDLTKVSPFLVSGAVPERAFFGREAEKATLVGTLTSNSVALLGGRRIGKTSLLYNVRTDLEQAGFTVFDADCQTVRTWEDFGQLATRRWKVEVDKDFTPESLFRLAEQLNSRADSGRVVFLLDEIDQLLQWDLQHAPSRVPETFFRACRTISQEGLAQFVFSGERTIATRLWDPHSPHWNFCRPVLLRQLTEQSTKELLSAPLRSLQVRLEDEDEALETVWAVTNGHPQIAQTLGDMIVKALNTRPSTERTIVAVRDLDAITESFEYREHFLETYWGQATTLERLLTTLAVSGTETLADFFAAVGAANAMASEDSVRAGLRMLELYGIVDKSSAGYELRARWFLEALQSYGSIGEVEDRLLRKL
ncbi:MAG: ATP-binding protein [Actinomycetota bacterium]|nr:ATP-binding protein [Actinomycetota bacterium]